jgi:hypothetical protein
MSIWWRGKSINGKRSLTSVSIPFPFILVLLGLFVAMIVPRLLTNDIPPSSAKYCFLVYAGFLLLFISKLFQFKIGMWTTWGCQHMPLLGKVFYLAGYV